MNQANMANYESSDRRLDSPPANLSKTTASQELEHYQLFQLVKLKWHAQNKNVTISMQNQSSSILLPDRPVVTAFVTFPGIERISKFHRRHVLATLFLNSPAGVSRTVSSSSSSLYVTTIFQERVRYQYQNFVMNRYTKPYCVLRQVQTMALDLTVVLEPHLHNNLIPQSEDDCIHRPFVVREIGPVNGWVYFKSVVLRLTKQIACNYPLE
jgi:hypothetical protein